MDHLNDIRLEFELPEEEARLGRTQPLSPDRSLVTQQRVGDTVVKATVNRVQYGTYSGKPACIVGLTFFFGFNGDTHGRFKSAGIEVRFSRAHGAHEPEEDSHRIHIAQLGPREVWGAPTATEIEQTTGVTMTVGGQAPAGGLSASIDPNIQRVYRTTVFKYRSIEGYTTSSHDSDEENVAVWKLKENAAQKDGIFPEFQGAAIILLPETGVGAEAVLHVTPKVAFSLNPLTYFKLKQRRRDPIRFDGKTSKGEPVDQGKDFAEKDFSWPRVFQVPTEYQNR
ncbi:hypothetical protein B0J12DRAFT_325668 [Macrophomina phaseolina]|uniref:Uncharacterized protein n=1 Tax=Macrophomina phaseolina TaxID=35725 RepID=A0ABQ8FV48_9PEZI|nr:hypothetical protein B0J12DRAFT_325668 [Macrophomina phaseolina]